jgi:hypothetical protein
MSKNNTIERARALLPSTLFATYAEWNATVKQVAAALSAEQAETRRVALLEGDGWRDGAARRSASLIALLRQHRCSVDGRLYVGECIDRGTCGCSCGLLAAPPGEGGTDAA